MLTVLCAGVGLRYSLIRGLGWRECLGLFVMFFEPFLSSFCHLMRYIVPLGEAAADVWQSFSSSFQLNAAF